MSQFDWKHALKQAEKMQSERRLTLSTQLFDWVKLLNQVFEDPVFRANLGLKDDIKAGKWLDGYVVEDTGLEFLELRAVLLRFPRKEDWIERQSPFKMYQTIQEEHREANRQQPKFARTTATVGQLQEAERKVRHAEAVARNVETKAKTEVAEVRAKAEQAVKAAEVKVERVKTEVETLRERCGALERENAELRAENARLKEALAKARRKATKKASV